MAKSYKFGLFRLNFSKSGIGGSFGIKGLRVGSGPRGGYVRVGKKNTYYKKGNSPSHKTNSLSLFNTSSPRSYQPQPTYAIDSADVSNMVDTSSAEIIQELDQVRSYQPKFPIMLVVGGSAIGCLLVGLLGSIAFLVLVSFFTLLACLIVLPSVKRTDIANGKIILNYELEEDVAKRFGQLQQAFHYFAMSGGMFHSSLLLNQYGQLIDITRTMIRPIFTLPQAIESNIGVFSLMAGKEILYFFPDKIFVYSPTGIGAVSYGDIYISVNTITEEKGTSWKHRKKDGSRDRRYSNNEMLTHTVSYTRLHLTSRNGLNEIFDFLPSHENAVHTLASAIVSMAIENQPSSPLL